MGNFTKNKAEQLEALQQFNLIQDGLDQQIEDNELQIHEWKNALDKLKREDDNTSNTEDNCNDEDMDEE